MSLREHLNVTELHHAYLIEGDRVVVLKELLELFEKGSVATLNNPDFHLYEHDAFLLEHAHHLRREQTMHSLEEHKYFVVAFNTMLSEAQNALLKTLEEPTAGTHFFFVTRTGEILFPTVRSRMQIIRKDPRSDLENQDLRSDLGIQFLNATIPERLKMIERYTKARKDDKSEAKEGARIFLESLERALCEKGIHGQPLDTGALALEDVVTAKRYLSDRSPSVKLLLEHLALTVPRIQDGV